MDPTKLSMLLHFASYDIFSSPSKPSRISALLSDLCEIEKDFEPEEGHS